VKHESEFLHSLRYLTLQYIKNYYEPSLTKDEVILHVPYSLMAPRA